MSSDRYKCAKCHYFFHELDMTKDDDGRLMCGDCMSVVYSDMAQPKEPVKRWICSQCKYESSWPFARCGSCGRHGSCMDKKMLPPILSDEHGPDNAPLVAPSGATSGTTYAAPQPDNSHYKHGSIDPLQYVEAMGDVEYRGACILNIVKYITRYPHKGTPLDDLAKAQDYLSKLIEHERAKS